MGFNKRILSEESIREVANNDNFYNFKMYFKADAFIVRDDFSANILSKIQKISIKDNDKILELMNECKTK